MRLDFRLSGSDKAVIIRIRKVKWRILGSVKILIKGCGGNYEG